MKIHNLKERAMNRDALYCAHRDCTNLRIKDSQIALLHTWQEWTNKYKEDELLKVIVEKLSGLSSRF